MDEKKLKTKLEIFNEDFSQKKNFELKLEKLFQHIFSNIFPNILNLPRIDFINSLTSTVKVILEEEYSNEIYSNENFFSLFLSMNKKFEKKYSEYNQILSSAWDNYQSELYNMKKEEDINIFKLTNFKKHCNKTQDYAIHYCNKSERGKYIIVYDKDNKNEKKFIICEKCRKSYYTYLFINFCQNCNCNYYCGLLDSKEDPNLLLATYSTPHCEPIANDKISCTKCKKPFYYNIKENMLNCLNPSCNYKIRPTSVNWKCNICSNYFKSDIKIFNNFELYYVKKFINMSLMVKEKAHPGILPCCRNLDEKNLVFFHKKDCNGTVYFWLLNQKLIVICEKCKAINFFNRFIWTCPNCGLHFKAKKEEIEEKLKKNLFKDLKLKLDINILLGNEYFLYNDLKTENMDNDCGYKMVRKKSFREILNMKRQELFKIKDKNDVNQINGAENDKNENTNDKKDVICKSNSKSNLKEDIKSSMKKRKNYLFEKLLKNQFISKKKLSNSKEKNNNFKRRYSGHIPLSEPKNDEEDIEVNQNEILVSEKKLIKLRERSGSNFLKKNIRMNNNLNDFKSKYEKKIVIDKENDKQLNNSDDAEKVNETSFIMEYNKKANKNSNSKKLPPMPFRAKSGRIFEKKENINEKEVYITDDINIKEKKEIIDKNKVSFEEKNHKNFNYENNKKNKNGFNLEYKLEYQNGNKTPRIIRKNILEGEKLESIELENNKNKNDENNYLKSNNVEYKSNLDLFNLKGEKSEKIVQNLEDKFNENYTQKKTKNKTDSNEDEEKLDNKEKIEKNNEEKEIYINNYNDLNNNEEKLLVKENKGDNDKIVKNNEYKEQDEELPILNINIEKEKSKKEIDDNLSSKNEKISSSFNDSKIENTIKNSSIEKDEVLYSSIQRQIKKILSKGKLPQFNIDNYKIEKQIGEGSFGLIFQVINKKTQIKYAMKKIIANNLNSLEIHQKEFEIVHQNSHPNILDILGICIRCLDQTTFVLYVLMDLALQDWDSEIEERKKTKKYYKENELVSILKQISSALFFLQSEKNIAHRDVKPENILVFKNGIYKLGDFGEAKINKIMKKNDRATIRGTEMYMSPLLFKSLQENKDDVQHDVFKSDVFSLGYCLIFAGSLDFKVISEIRYINSDFKLRKILQRIFMLKYSSSFIELILKMITNKEEDRVDFIGLKKLIEESNL